MPIVSQESKDTCESGATNNRGANDNCFTDSRYWRWFVNHRPLSLEQEQVLRREAMSVLIEAVHAGEIITVDGVATPLSKRILALHGLRDFEMNSNWICSAQDWVCPCCARSKFQISRVGKKGQILAKLVVHHDHMTEAMKAAFHAEFESAGTAVEQIDGLRLVEQIGKAFAAYEEVLVCEDCNNADTEAKKRVTSPPYFSFSIGQIRRFINSQDHQPHQVDAQQAALVWQEAKPAYEIRIRLIRAVAHAAATDTHWYEPYARGSYAIPLLGSRIELGDHAIRQWVSIEQLLVEMGPKRQLSTPNLSRWRIAPQKCGREIPDNFLAMLRSDQERSQAWDSIPDDWHCPVCLRSKHQTVYVGGKGKISFYPKSTPARERWTDVKTICNQCESVLMSLKLEVSAAVGSASTHGYSCVCPEELAGIVSARPHSPHLIRPAKAAALVASVVERLSRARDGE